MSANNSRRNRRRNRHSTTSICNSVAGNALLNASQSGFRLFDAGQPLVPDKSSSSDSDEMVADLAARQIEHCLAAWSYLSQSMVALLNGKEDIAIHLAYYSEVRAANSLLASTGIAIKALPNYYIDSSKARCTFDVPTHKALREIWSAWCVRPDAIDAFETLSVAPSTKLTDVFSAMGLSGSHQNSLLNWGYELINFTDDHSSRNVASYNTNMVYGQIPSFDKPEHGKLIALIWDHLSSTGVVGQFRFEQLYAQYLIWGYCFDYATSAGHKHVNASDAFKVKYDEIISALSKSTGASQKILKLILPFSEEEDERFELFNLASSSDTAAENIISRAFILTRLATNKLNNNLIQTSCVEGVSWIKTWLFEAGILSDDTEALDIFNASGEYYETAIELSDISNRDILNQMAIETMQSCRLDLGLCWGIDL